MKLKVGDTIKVTIGKDRGKTGKVERVIPAKEAVIVAGVNLYKKHVKKQGDKAGQTLELPRPLALSKVALICPNCHQPTRVGYEGQGKKKLRICKKCRAKL